MNIQTNRLRAAIFLCALVFTAGASAQERLKVRLGIVTTGSQAAFCVGVKKGIFAKKPLGRPQFSLWDLGCSAMSV